MSEANVPDAPVDVSMPDRIRTIIDGLGSEREELIYTANHLEERANNTRQRVALLDNLIVEWKRILRAEEES